MEPIATYSEQRFDGRRVFTLLPGEVVVAGSATLSSDFNARVPLATLNPLHSSLRIRNPICWLGVGMSFVAFVVCGVLVDGLGMSWNSPVTVMVGCFVMAGVILSLATARKVEFVRFCSNAGVHVLDLARAGPESDQLDQFVDALVAQIKAVD